MPSFANISSLAIGTRYRVDGLLAPLRFAFLSLSKYLNFKPVAAVLAPIPSLVAHARAPDCDYLCLKSIDQHSPI